MVILLLLIFASIRAQPVTPSVVNINGFSAELPDGYLTISVGESAITTLNGLSGIITQGFLQPELDPPCSDFQLSYFPNPVSDRITIRDSACGRIIHRIEVFDLLGAQILKTRLVNREADLTSLGTGIFIVRGYSMYEQLLGTFKIVKVKDR